MVASIVFTFIFTVPIAVAFAGAGYIITDGLLR